MIYKGSAITLALVSVVAAAPAVRRQDACQDAYKQCISAGTAEVACSCTLTSCLGEDSARIRDFCATATASLAQPTSTSIPGGCNPAHPGSCPSSYFSTSATTTTSAAFTSVSGIPGGCNPAHPGSCPSSYFSTTATSTAVPTFTSIAGIPGGCNPAHPGSCPSSYFSTTVSVTPTVASTAAPSQGATTYTDPTPVGGKTWTVQDLTRYCGEGNTGCDYNFAIVADGKTERCTVIRMPGSDAATESWSNQPCTDGSKFTASWGYITNPAPPFAVLTVVEGKELAWFGVANVNEQEVTPSNPFGSGQYGNITEQVYTY
ncbi:hypothetical protein TruAng_001855 [Truncatella angustata]|nr:hypothetical protein TruAng_001855 [Truncatella angustata]